jgi:hypothetical protein
MEEEVFRSLCVIFYLVLSLRLIPYTIILTFIGINWYSKFLNRHPDIKLLRSRALDQSRKDATNHDIARHWFDLYSTTLLKYDINECDIYNMDEKGCMKGIGDNTKVFVPGSEFEAFSAQPGNREWVSIRARDISTPQIDTPD